MIGRTEEIQQLNDMYSSTKFEFMIMYGRRRIGKTTILLEFADQHRSIFFSAQEKNDALNLHDFSRIVQEFFDSDYIAAFENWEDAFGYVGKKTANNTTDNNKTVLIIDEFPFLASPNPSIKSILQHIIDHDWKNKNILLVLCGSSVSFMINDVMGYKSPLYGRCTGNMEVLPFNYYESGAFFPEYSPEDKIISYGILGGVPRYLNAFDDEQSIKDNIVTNILKNGVFLNDEPQALLRMELREPSVYNSILEAVASGKNRVSEISDRIKEDKGKCSKYILVLQTLRLLEKHVPCGEKKDSKKGIYEITDNYYKFWYRYVFANRSYYSMLGDYRASEEIMTDINEYMGPVFEDICRQYLTIMAGKGRLPFVPSVMGKWWGNNPVIKAQDDVDILALSKDRTSAIFCECKFRNKPMPMEEYDDLLTAASAFDVRDKYYFFFSKSGYTKPFMERARKDSARLLTIKDLFDLS